MKNFLSIIITLFFTFPAFPQESNIPELPSTASLLTDETSKETFYSGFIEPQIYLGPGNSSVFGIKNPEWTFLTDNSLRLTVNAGNHTRAYSNFHLYYRPLFDSTDLILEPDAKKLDFRIYTLYTRLMPADWFYVTAGKSQLDWGLGFAYPSAGRINILKNVLEPEMLGEGINNINLTIYTPSSSIILALIPPGGEKKLSLTGAACKIEFRWANTDISFQGSRIYREKYHSSIEMTVSQEFSGFLFYGGSAIFKPNNYVYFDENGNIISERNDITGENKSLDDNINFSGTFGFNKAISDNGFLILEYQHRTDGYTEDELQSFVKALNSPEVLVKYAALSNLQFAHLSKNHLYVRYTHNIRDIIEPGIDIILGFPAIMKSEYSAFFSPVVSSDFFNGGTLKIGCYVPLGSNHSEFGLFPYYYQTFIRMKVYF